MINPYQTTAVLEETDSKTPRAARPPGRLPAKPRGFGLAFHGVRHWGDVEYRPRDRRDPPVLACLPRWGWPRAGGAEWGRGGVPAVPVGAFSSADPRDTGRRDTVRSSRRCVNCRVGVEGVLRMG